MILAALASSLVLAVGPDPCAPVPATPTPDAAAAAEYRAVGDAERAVGSRDTAAAAYRAALERDPEDGASRAALAQLCHDDRRSGAFDRGVRLMEAGDRAAAIAAFEEVRAAGRDTAASLLEGICLYEQGEDARAAPLLAEAEQDPQHRDGARFFQGLIALRAGRSDDAADLLHASAADRQLGPIALGLVRDARRDGRLVLSVLFESGWDSNVSLTSDMPIAGGGQGALPDTTRGDGSAGATVLARLTPFGDTGPFLRADATYRDQFAYDPLDLRGAGVAAGWQGGRGGRYALAEAGYEYRDLGGTPYLSAARLLGSLRQTLGNDGRASAGLTYFARWESFRASEDASYSGLRHFGEADLTFELAPRSTATIAWHAGRDGAREADLSWWEQGPRAGVRIQLTHDVRLGLDAAWSWRRYDALDTALQVQRVDNVLDGAALLETELADRWTLRLSVNARKALSNAPAFEYTKIVPMVGLAYTIGLF